MKKIVFFSLLVISITANCQQAQTDMVAQKYVYDSVPGDPLHGRIYHLDNGLTVFISVNKAEPKIQTMIAVKAGSKYDPSDATGLAHYLEHMLFKGTTHYSTSDYSKEKPLLDKIETLFETYRHTTDKNKRELIYKKIDSISYIASKFAIANEYYKMMQFIGSEGTNAHTSEDKTVFEENIPSDELDTWLEIESDRFKDPVMRLFHTELEVVYEEKNMRLDDESEMMNQALMSGLFPKHPYGLHTTLGTIHDLKNPSLKDIIRYFHTYYVPDNMVITLCGDVNPDKAIESIDKWFGSPLSPQNGGRGVAHPVPDFISPKEDSIAAPVIKTLVTESAPFVEVGYAFGGATSADADMLRLIQKMMWNGKTGLLDEDMGVKLYNAEANIRILKDHSVFILSAAPRDKLTPEQVKDSLLVEIEKIKSGNFPQWLMEGTLNNMKVEEMNDFHSNYERGQRFTEAFATGESWNSSVNRLNRISKISKNELVRFAKAHFRNNYVVVYKKKGQAEQTEKINKPPITSVQTNPDAESDFVKKIETEKREPLQPVFADYGNRIKQYELQPGLNLYYVKNEEDSLFELDYIFDFGSNTQPRLEYALRCFSGGSTSYFNSKVIKQEFFRMGCSFNFHVESNQTTVSLKGLSKNFPQALNLLESMFNDISFGTRNWDQVVDGYINSRDFYKKDKSWFLYALNSYTIYGKTSSFTYSISEDLIKSLYPAHLQDLIRNMRTFSHTITYYGPLDAPHLIAGLQEYHKTPVLLKPGPKPREYPTQDFANFVYIYSTDIRQAEVYIYQPGIKYTPQLQPVISLYNQYFGNSSGSLAWQALRESNALAYSFSSYFHQPTDTTQTGFDLSTFNTQADKLPAALDAMMNLLHQPLAFEPQLWLSAKDAVLKNISSTRTNRKELLSSYIKALNLGLNYDINKNIYESVQNISFNELKNFHNKYISNEPYIIVIIGDVQKMDMAALKKYGTITYINQKDIYGF